MQNRQEIREQLGILEERLEELGALASANERSSVEEGIGPQFGTEVLLKEALDSLRDLNQLVHEQNLFKSISAHDFLKRICGLLVSNAVSQGCDIAISHYGEGSISLEMAELVMGAILSGFRACLRGQKSFNQEKRLELHLFSVGSIYLEVRAAPGEMLFRLIHDARGFGPRDVEVGTERQFQKLREHIARCGGWFGYSSLNPYGGVIEFKVPLMQNRVESMIIRKGSFDLLIPSSCIAEVHQQDGGQKRIPKTSFLLKPDELEGLTVGERDSPVVLTIGVADVKFRIGCDSLVGQVKVRHLSAEGFAEEGSWLKTLGVFHEGGIARSLPFLDGEALVKFHRIRGGKP